VNRLIKLGAALLAGEAALALGPRRVRRRRAFAAARLRARQLGRPLVVVGAPGAGVVNAVVGRDYGCGDLCIDLRGCGDCDKAVTGRAEDVFQLIPDDSSVVFVSCTLEYVDDPVLIMAELQRIAGPHVFVVCVEPLSLTAFLYPGAKRRIFRAPHGDGVELLWKPLPWAAEAPAEAELRPWPPSRTEGKSTPSARPT